jgi:hypothetical protein
MATTTNYGWATPDDTDLVKDGAAAIRTLGSSADTTVKNLSPGTTAGDLDYYTSGTAKARLGIGTAGQVLKVNSGATAPEWATDASGMANPMTTTADIIYSSSGSTPDRLGIGTAGQVLAVNSGATAPEWVTPVSGMTVLATGSLSGSSTVISSIPATYNNLRLLIRNPRGASDNRELYIRLNGDTGTNYNYSLARENFNVAANSSFLPVGFNMDNSVNNGTLFMDFSDYANTSVWKLAKSFSAFTNATNNSNSTFADYLHFWKSTSAITSITMYVDSGDWAGGTYVLYGVK